MTALLAQVLHHHDPRPEGRDRVGDAFANDVEGRAVDRFEHRGEAPNPIEIGWVEVDNWRLKALGSVLMSVILAAILLWLDRSGGAVPYIVEVDHQGALGRKPVGDPYLGLRPTQEGHNHRLATTGRDDMSDGCRAAEPPLPYGLLPPQQAATAVGFSLHTCRSLVAGDDGAARTSAAMAWPATAKGLAARAGMLAMAPSDSVRPNSPLQHLDQPVVADQLAGMQIDGEGHDALA